MKLKRLAFAMAVSAIAAPMSAQGIEEYDLEAGDYMNEFIQQYNQQAQIEQKNWDEAYYCWRGAFLKDPAISPNLYLIGPTMLYYMIHDANTDAAKKEQVFGDMMAAYDAHIANLETLNAKSKKKQYTEGDILALKAYYYNDCGPLANPSTYSLATGYKMFSDGIHKILESGGKEVFGQVLYNYFQTSMKMYEADKEGFGEQFLDDYLTAKDVCEVMLQLAKEAEDSIQAKKIVAEYDAPLANIEYYFSQSGAANRDQIIAIYTPKVEANKANLAYLRSAMTIMANNDCDDTDVYYKAAEYAYAIEPTYESAIGLAQQQQKLGNNKEMITYYNKALELAGSDTQRGSICYRISAGLSKSGQYTGAIKYAEDAARFNPSLEGKSNLQLANIYAQLGQYSQSLSYCTKASQSDITVSGAADRLKAQIQKIQANTAAAAKAKAAYDAYLAKKKAEEDFWNGAR